MRSDRHRARAALPRHRAAQAFLFAVALLLAQWAGMLHRIEHAGQGAPTSAAAQSWPSAGFSPVTPHSCVIFDGACLADLLPTTLVDFVAEPLAHVAPRAIGFTSWPGRFQGHFQPRAPPAA